LRLGIPAVADVELVFHVLNDRDISRMNENQPAPAMPNDIAMHKRRITLEDGRYMLFYTFGDEEPPPAAISTVTTGEEPPPAPQAEEERHV
jgi:hypothetical protein